jgi:hypothetical protein
VRVAAPDGRGPGPAPCFRKLDDDDDGDEDEDEDAASDVGSLCVSGGGGLEGCRTTRPGLRSSRGAAGGAGLARVKFSHVHMIIPARTGHRDAPPLSLEGDAGGHRCARRRR